MITEIIPDGSTNTLELGLFDPYENVYKTIGSIPFSAAYGTYSQVIDDRFVAMVTCKETNEKMYGKVTVYDIETGELHSTDDYEIYNIVQFITSFKNDEIIFLYYEANTQDRVIMHYNLITKETGELFRESNYNNEENSPVSITTDEDKIILVLQYIKDGVYHTQFEWISQDGELLKKEEPDFYSFFDSTDYQITDFNIEGNYYYLKAIIDDHQEYFIFTRENDDFHVILPAICILNDFVSNYLTNVSGLLFYQDDGVLGNLVNVDLKNNSLKTYQFSGDFLGDNSIKLIKKISENDLIIFYDNDSANYEYQLIPDYSSINSKPLNASLYVSPREQLKQLISSNHATPEEIKEKIESTKQTENSLKENNFRWKFVYK